MDNFDIQSKIARLRREEALKVKDIKEIAFGEYSVQVPSFNLCKLWKGFTPRTISNGAIAFHSLVTLTLFILQLATVIDHSRSLPLVYAEKSPNHQTGAIEECLL